MILREHENDIKSINNIKYFRKIIKISLIKIITIQITTIQITNYSYI